MGPPSWRDPPGAPRKRMPSLTIRSIAEVGTLEGSQRGPSRPAVPSGTVGGTDPNAAGTAGHRPGGLAATSRFLNPEEMGGLLKRRLITFEGFDPGSE